MEISMKIKWYGHACFEIVSENYTVVIDPYKSNSVPGLSMPRIDANKVLCTHEHEDHNNKRGVRIVKNDKCPFRFSTLKTYHDDENGARRGKNSIFILENDGVRIAHLGDLGCMPTDEQIASLEGVDAVMIPVGGYYTVEPALAADLVRRISAKVVIPMHYRSEEWGYGVLATVDDFIDLLDEYECYEYGSSIGIDKSTERQIAVLTL